MNPNQFYPQMVASFNKHNKDLNTCNIINHEPLTTCDPNIKTTFYSTSFDNNQLSNSYSSIFPTTHTFKGYEQYLSPNYNNLSNFYANLYSNYKEQQQQNHHLNNLALPAHYHNYILPTQNPNYYYGCEKGEDKGFNLFNTTSPNCMTFVTCTTSAVNNIKDNYGKQQNDITRYSSSNTFNNNPIVHHDDERNKLHRKKIFNKNHIDPKPKSLNMDNRNNLEMNNPIGSNSYVDIQFSPKISVTEHERHVMQNTLPFHPALMFNHNSPGNFNITSILPNLPGHFITCTKNNELLQQTANLPYVNPGSLEKIPNYYSQPNSNKSYDSIPAHNAYNFPSNNPYWYPYHCQMPPPHYYNFNMTTPNLMSSANKQFGNKGGLNSHSEYCDKGGFLSSMIYSTNADNNVIRSQEIKYPKIGLEEETMLPDSHREAIINPTMTYDHHIQHITTKNNHITTYDAQSSSSTLYRLLSSCDKKETKVRPNDFPSYANNVSFTDIPGYSEPKNLQQGDYTKQFNSNNLPETELKDMPTLKPIVCFPSQILTPQNSNKLITDHNVSLHDLNIYSGCQKSLIPDSPKISRKNSPVPGNYNDIQGENKNVDTLEMVKRSNPQTFEANNFEQIKSTDNYNRMNSDKNESVNTDNMKETKTSVQKCGPGRKKSLVADLTLKNSTLQTPKNKFNHTKNVISVKKRKLSISDPSGDKINLPKKIRHGTFMNNKNRHANESQSLKLSLPCTPSTNVPTKAKNSTINNVMINFPTTPTVFSYTEYSGSEDDETDLEKQVTVNPQQRIELALTSGKRLYDPFAKSTMPVRIPLDLLILKNQTFINNDHNTKEHQISSIMDSERPKSKRGRPSAKLDNDTKNKNHNDIDKATSNDKLTKDNCDTATSMSLDATSKKKFIEDGIELIDKILAIGNSTLFHSKKGLNFLQTNHYPNTFIQEHLQLHFDPKEETQTIKHEGEFDSHLGTNNDSKKFQTSTRIQNKRQNLKAYLSKRRNFLRNSRTKQTPSSNNQQTPKTKNQTNPATRDVIPFLCDCPPDLKENQSKKDKYYQSELKKFFPNKAVGETILHTVSRRNLSELCSYLLHSPEYSNELSVNVKEHAGYTPLHEACLAGSYDCVKLLLRHGANPNVALPDGTRPIHDLMELGNLSLIKLLLLYGADAKIKTYAGKDYTVLAKSPKIKTFIKDYISMCDQNNSKNTHTLNNANSKISANNHNILFEISDQSLTTTAYIFDSDKNIHVNAIHLSQLTSTKYTWPKSSSLNDLKNQIFQDIHKTCTTLKLEDIELIIPSDPTQPKRPAISHNHKAKRNINQIYLRLNKDIINILDKNIVTYTI